MENISVDPGANLFFCASSRNRRPVVFFLGPKIEIQTLLDVPLSSPSPVPTLTVYGIAEIIDQVDQSNIQALHVTFL